MTSLRFLNPRVSLLQNKPKTWSLENLLEAQLGQTLLLVTPSVSEKATELLFFDLAKSLKSLPSDLDTLIVIGGGNLMDEAKIWRAHHAPGTQLIAIPSLWGSGAEVSPVADRKSA